MLEEVVGQIQFADSRGVVTIQDRRSGESYIAVQFGVSGGKYSKQNPTRCSEKSWDPQMTDLQQANHEEQGICAHKANEPSKETKKQEVCQDGRRPGVLERKTPMLVCILSLELWRCSRKRLISRQRSYQLSSRGHLFCCSCKHFVRNKKSENVKMVVFSEDLCLPRTSPAFSWK